MITNMLSPSQLNGLGKLISLSGGDVGVTVEIGYNIPVKGVPLGETAGKGKAIGVTVFVGAIDGVGVNESSGGKEGM